MKEYQVKNINEYTLEWAKDTQEKTPNLAKEMAQKAIPAIVFWNRIEGRPRSKDDFSRALQAEIRDPLWMLAKQWQLGEFKGEDAGSPAFAKLHLESRKLEKFRAGKKRVASFTEHVPLEARVEQRPIPFSIGGQKASLDLRLLMGRKWLKMLKIIWGNGELNLDYKSCEDAFIRHFRFEIPDPSIIEDAQRCAHPEAWQQYAAIAGRCMDGGKLYMHLTQNKENRAYDGIDDIVGTDKDNIKGLEGDFIKWFEELFYQPEGTDAWTPDRLEYQFACSVPDEGKGDKVLRAEEYYHGHLDWYNVDIDSSTTDLGENPNEFIIPPSIQSFTKEFIPTPVIFNGMPDTRWWAFEDRMIDFGGISPKTEELAKLLLIEFALVYSNDWFFMPFVLPTGTFNEIKGLVVTNVFGERFWVSPAGRSTGNNWQRWSMFTLTNRGDTLENKEKAEEGGKQFNGKTLLWNHTKGKIGETGLLLLPTVPKVQEGKPLEKVAMIRDELSNMVWGIETVIPLVTGSGVSGHEAAAELRQHYQKINDAGLEDIPNPSSLPEPKADIRYQLMTTVPENWIPFITVHEKGSRRKVKLQRASMPRILENDSKPEGPEKVKPRTTLLREGLDQNPQKGYYLFEEEVPRAGIHVSQSFQRTRWHDGKVFVWFGARKQVGRGEGSSGLIFDQLVPVERSSEGEE